MQLKFRRNKDPLGDDPDWETYHAAVNHIEPIRKKDRDGRFWNGWMLLPRDTPVKNGDQVLHDDGNWYSLSWEVVRPVSGQISGFEVYF